jgi:hypothetical protein
MHYDRREFFKSLLSAAGGFVAAGPAETGPAVRVEAQASFFFAQPDGQRCLVRFSVQGLKAPAGRLRVFDFAHRMLGTAGVIALADGRLYGELWLPVGDGLHLATELAAPGLKAPLRTQHWVRPAPRWTIYWGTLLEPVSLERRFATLTPVKRAVEAAALRAAGAAVNPMPGGLAPASGDLPFLRLAEAALLTGEAFALALSSFAAVDASQCGIPTLATVLNGSGVSRVVVTGGSAVGHYRLDAPDGSGVLAVALAPGSDPESLAFADGGDRMRRLVEQWLLEETRRTDQTAKGERGAHPVALVVGVDPERLPQAAASVREWNSHFAFPRIVVGQSEPFFEDLGRRYAGEITGYAPAHTSTDAPPTPAEVTSLGQARAGERARRAEAMIDSLVRVLASGGRGLEAIANELAFSVPGTLVFNPSPYPRSDLVRLADTSYRVVTDVPALVYVYVPLGGRADEGRWRTMEDDGSHAVETASFRVELEPQSGTIRSLISRGDGIEWIRPDGPGANAIEGAQVETLLRETLPGVGSRIVAVRRLPQHGAVRSMVTIYQGLPWVDLVNEAPDAGERAPEYRFAFTPGVSGVEWEIPAGAARGAAPLAFTHLRWVRLLGGRGTVSLASRDAAWANVSEDGTLTSYGPRGSAGYRLAVSPPGGFAYPDAPWQLGWSVEPLLAAPVPGTGGARLPSFGSLLVIDQPYVALVSLQAARDGNGLIVYLQELSGRARVATLGAGLIGFDDTRLVDLVERDLGPPAMAMVNGAGVTLAAHGVVALRLLGPRLAGG